MDIANILSNLGFQWQMALANLLNFLFILWLLKRFAFTPIQKTLTARQCKIDEGLENAKKASSELQLAEKNRDKTLLNARIEASHIISQANKNAENMIDRAKQSALDETKQIVINAKKTIASDKQTMLGEIKHEIVELVISSTEKLTKQKIDKKQEEKLIKDLLK
jgi:F-type H+-transporting ATPase subunit b